MQVNSKIFIYEAVEEILFILRQLLRFFRTPEFSNEFQFQNFIHSQGKRAQLQISDKVIRCSSIKYKKLNILRSFIFIKFWRLKKNYHWVRLLRTNISS